MTIKLLLIVFFQLPVLHAALEISKIEHEGCPENSFCRKETGETRIQWLKKIEELGQPKSNEKKLNAELAKGQGYLISAWAKEEASVSPNIMMWNSPCKQHNTEALKYYIVDYFVKSLDQEALKDWPNLFFNRAYSIDHKNNITSTPIPRDEYPLYVENGQLHFLREEEGKYYSLSIASNGKLNLGKITEQTLSKRRPMRELVCPKEMIDVFLREAPSPNFFEEYNCKEIWNATTNSYQRFLFGRSCT